MGRFIRGAAALALAIFVAVPAWSQDRGRALATTDEGKGWEAVGRIQIAGLGYCTGALIAPDLVLTAAHCLYDPVSGALISSDALEFAAGLRSGRAAALRRVRRAVLHPDYVYEGRDKVDRVSSDLALLELDRPIREADIRPFATGAAPRTGDEVAVVFYATGQDEVPTLEEPCAVLAHQNRVQMISCRVNFGASGAPVFATVDGGRRVVAVVSAKAESEGQAVALTAELDPALDVLRAKLAGSDGVFTRAPAERAPVSRGTAGAGAGAKFLRP